MKPTLPSFALMVVLAAAPLHAASVIVSNTFNFTNPTTLSNSISNSDLSGTVAQTFTTDSPAISLPKFDTSLGTLTSVTYSLAFSTAQTSGSATFGTLGLISQATVDRVVRLTVDLGAFGSPLQSTNTATLTTANLLDILGLPVGGGTATYGPVTGVNGFTTSAFSSSPQLAAVSGGGTYNVHLSSADTLTLSKLAGFGTYSLSSQSQYIGTISAEYNYVAIPEPGTCALFGVGLLLSGWKIRKSLRS